MAMQERILIAGAGPVGLVAAANLLRLGVPVTVFETGTTLSTESRASTFHPPTLDMLHALGAAESMLERGLVARYLQYRSKQDGVFAQFDFNTIADVTNHPYRLQFEQSGLTRILYEQLRNNGNFELLFNSTVKDVTQNDKGVKVAVDREGRIEHRTGPWLIGADGARSDVRRSLGIEFEGFTWPERLLVVSTPFDFRQQLPDLASVSYVADPHRWHFLLQIPGLWRVMFRVAPHESDELATAPKFVQSLMAEVVPGISSYEISHVTLYKVHQRVAKSFRSGRAFLAGDAGHINNPLGGMGMNGGIHDAINLTDRLAQVWHGEMPVNELDRYNRQRRQVTLEYIEKQSIENKRNLESDGTEFRKKLRQIASDRGQAYEYLLKASMIASLRRATELG